MTTLSKSSVKKLFKALHCLEPPVFRDGTAEILIAPFELRLLDDDILTIEVGRSGLPLACARVPKGGLNPFSSVEIDASTKKSEDILKDVFADAFDFYVAPSRRFG